MKSPLFSEKLSTHGHSKLEASNKALHDKKLAEMRNWLQLSGKMTSL